MNKKELINSVAETGNVSKKEATAALDMVIETIMSEVAAGNTISLAGFGTFKTKLRDARTARNPQTGETIEVPAKYALTFKPTSTLKAEINE